MLRRGAVVVLSALAALALSEPGTPVKKAIGVSAGVDAKLDEDSEVAVNLALGIGDYPEDPTYPEEPEPSYPEETPPPEETGGYPENP